MISLILAISAILDYYLNAYLLGTIFKPLLVITALVFIYPYFKKDSDYIKTIFIFSIIKVVLLDYLILFNVVVYIILAYLIIELYNSFKFKLPSVLIITSIIIVIYVGLVNVFFHLTGYIDFNFNRILVDIYSSLIFNLLYGTLGFYTIKSRISRFDKYKYSSIIKRNLR